MLLNCRAISPASQSRLRSTCLGWNHPQWAGTSYNTTVNQENSHKCAHRPFWWMQSFNWGSIFPGLSRWQPRLATTEPSFPALKGVHFFILRLLSNWWLSCDLEGICLHSTLWVASNALLLTLRFSGICKCIPSEAWRCHGSNTPAPWRLPLAWPFCLSLPWPWSALTLAAQQIFL